MPADNRVRLKPQPVTHPLRSRRRVLPFKESAAQSLAGAGFTRDPIRHALVTEDHSLDPNSHESSSLDCTECDASEAGKLRQQRENLRYAGEQGGKGPKGNGSRCFALYPERDRRGIPAYAAQCSARAWAPNGTRRPDCPARFSLDPGMRGTLQPRLYPLGSPHPAEAWPGLSRNACLSRTEKPNPGAIASTKRIHERYRTSTGAPSGQSLARQICSAPFKAGFKRTS